MSHLWEDVWNLFCIRILKFVFSVGHYVLFWEKKYVYENILKEMGYLKYGAKEFLNEYKKSLEERNKNVLHGNTFI